MSSMRVNHAHPGGNLMWCNECQQDVPGVASPDDSGICCARCSGSISAADTAAASRTMRYIDLESDDHGNDVDDVEEYTVEDFDLLDDDLDKYSESPPLDEHDWRLDEDLRSAELMVKLFADQPDDRLSVPIGALAPAAAPSASPPGPRPPSPRRYGRVARERFGFLLWSLVSFGLMAFVFGGVLLGWGYITDRDDLWRLGLPVALAGQAAMVLGVVLQMEGLWQRTRATRHTLGELDHQLYELRQTTNILTTTRTDGPQPISSHLSQAANPNVLLADLKGQLDALAYRLDQRNRVA